MTHSLNHPPSHSFIDLLIHLLFHSLTHPLTRFLVLFLSSCTLSFNEVPPPPTTPCLWAVPRLSRHLSGCLSVSLPPSFSGSFGKERRVHSCRVSKYMFGFPPIRTRAGRFFSQTARTDRCVVNGHLNKLDWESSRAVSRSTYLFLMRS